MNFVVKRCKKCQQIMGACSPDALIHKANDCNGKLEELNISWDELSIIEDISTDKSFLQAMIDLKEKDIIEYNLKMSQFKSQLEQQKSRKTQDNKTLKCPKCGCTNIQLINRKWSPLMGFMTNKVDRTCVNCKHKF